MSGTEAMSLHGAVSKNWQAVYFRRVVRRWCAGAGWRRPVVRQSARSRRRRRPRRACQSRACRASGALHGVPRERVPLLGRARRRARPALRRRLQRSADTLQPPLCESRVLCLSVGEPVAPLFIVGRLHPTPFRVLYSLHFAYPPLM